MWGILLRPTRTLFIGVYVDDVVVAHNDSHLLSWFASEFTGPNGFNAKHLGKLSWFLGMAVDQCADHSITIHQTQYIEKLLDRFIPLLRKVSLDAGARVCSVVLVTSTLS